MTEKLDLDAIEARWCLARCEVNHLCEGKTSWTTSIPAREDDTDIVLTNSFRDVPALVVEVRRLQTDLAAEHALMIMYSDRCAAVRRKLQEVGAIARHEEIANLDAITRLAEAGKEA